MNTHLTTNFTFVESFINTAAVSLLNSSLSKHIAQNVYSLETSR